MPRQRVSPRAPEFQFHSQLILTLQKTSCSPCPLPALLTKPEGSDGAGPWTEPGKGSEHGKGGEINKCPVRFPAGFLLFADLYSTFPCGAGRDNCGKLLENGSTCCAQCFRNPTLAVRWDKLHCFFCGIKSLFCLAVGLLGGLIM